MQSVLRIIRVWVAGAEYNMNVWTAPHVLTLPLGANRWEVYQPLGEGTVQFMAVNDAGESIEIRVWVAGSLD